MPLMQSVAQLRPLAFSEPEGQDAEADAGNGFQSVTTSQQGGAGGTDVIDEQHMFAL